ncbi:MAG: hypothetical protein ABI675_19610 [Chitinophagaceae bacterium]
MITVEGYSKDPGIIPEGIAVTFGKDMIIGKGGLLRFIRWFESCLKSEEDFFMHKCKNGPRYDNLQYVYIIVCNRVYYRCYYGGYEKGETTGYLTPDADDKATISWPRINLAGPLLRSPEKIIRKGFQGFRYTTKLF